VRIKEDIICDGCAAEGQFGQLTSRHYQYLVKATDQMALITNISSGSRVSATKYHIALERRRHLDR